MTELVLDCSEEEGLEAVKMALENTEGVSEYFVEDRQIVAKTSVGFPRILWSYGEKLLIDISDSRQKNQVVLDVSAEKEIWANIGADPEKFKGKFLSEFKKVRTSYLQNVGSTSSEQKPEGKRSEALATNRSHTKEVDSYGRLSNGVKKYTLVATVAIVSTFLIFGMIGLGISMNTPDIGAAEGDSQSAIEQSSGDGSSDINPYTSSLEETTRDENTPESSTDSASDNTTLDYQELSPSISCTLASHFDSSDYGDYHVGIMESEFHPDTCDDVLASNPDVNMPRYEAECEGVDTVSPLVYASKASLSETQEEDYHKYQAQRSIAVVLTPDTLSAEFMRCRLQTFSGKAKLHIATPMSEWSTTKDNLDRWNISENVTLWAYNSSVIVSEDEYNDRDKELT